jgi:hypothetical protein
LRNQSKSVDLFVRLNQIAPELLEAVEFGQFAFGFVQRAVEDCVRATVLAIYARSRS